MQKPVAIAVVAAAAAASAGCTAGRSESGGPAVSRTYQVGSFERIEVAGPYEVDVRTGSGPSVSASGPERSIERMVVEVDGDTLKVHPKKRGGFRFSWSDRDPVRLAVTVPSLRAAEIAGSGDIRVDRVTGESFEGGVAGSGDLRLGEVKVSRLKMGIAGSGEIRAERGSAGRAEYDIAGSGDIDVGSVTADVASVSIAGSGNVNGNATGTARVEIAGSGNVRLRGGARCEVSRAGSGNVDCS